MLPSPCGSGSNCRQSKSTRPNPQSAGRARSASAAPAAPSATPATAPLRTVAKRKATRNGRRRSARGGRQLGPRAPSARTPSTPTRRSRRTMTAPVPGQLRRTNSKTWRASSGTALLAPPRPAMARRSATLLRRLLSSSRSTKTFHSGNAVGTPRRSCGRPSLARSDFANTLRTTLRTLTFSTAPATSRWRRCPGSASRRCSPWTWRSLIRTTSPAVSATRRATRT
mmetsp:Transcript_28063/g.89586  ORF Transcript_28063/g.89586 Transcript_28063/m.89586 type:complete len:226 (-) Transcript_28063:2661-3338(-)